MEEHIENIIVALEVLGSAILAAVSYWFVQRRRKRKEAEKRTRKDVMFPPSMLLLLVPVLSGCGLFGSSEPTVRALTPVLVQVAEHVANRGLELAELPAQCEWEQDVDDPDKLLVMCTVDTGKRR
jgi:hypothetical protein